MLNLSGRLCAGMLFLSFAALFAPISRAAEKLEILDAGYPRAFFFRSSEAAAARPVPFDQWNRAFSRLGGIMGKALDEEIPGRSKNIAYFTRFKQANPGQAVLLHFNGNARDPRYNGDRFFAGHWLYYNGCRITAPLPARGGEATVPIQNPNLFKVNTGRFQNSNEDLAICAIGPDGKPDWNRCEQVQLLALDAAQKTLTIRRGAFGTKPLAFPQGSYIAAHASEGPWGGNSNLLWFYNFSSTCPRDARGRTCADVLVKEFKELFGPGGKLELFDGLSMDVSQFDRTPRTPRGGRGGRGVDCDGDGRLDDGVIDGMYVYGIGQTAFHTALRRALGEGRIIQADGMGWRNQRSFGQLNGIESEGFPTLNDWEMADWSGGLNRHFAWRANARPPAFNYINHKYMAGGDRERPKVPFSTHRLAFAAAVFTDSAICYSYPPPGDPGDLIPIWDELVMGAENREHWLGRPIGQAVRLGRSTPDLLGGAGQNIADSFAMRWLHTGTLTNAGGRLKLTGKTDDRKLSATLDGLEVPAGDLLVFMTLRGEPRAGYDPLTPRQAWLTLKTDSKIPLSPLTPARVGAWVTPRNSEAVFYYRDLPAGSVSLTLEVEGEEPVFLRDLSAHNAPDAIARRFEHGMVLANPSTHPYTFNLGELAPGASFRRLRGTPRQDTQTNNGEPLGPSVTLSPRDALFLAATPQ